MDSTVELYPYSRPEVSQCKVNSGLVHPPSNVSVIAFGLIFNVRVTRGSECKC